MKIMKHLMRYEGYTTAQRVDDILDKISKHGIKSLSNLEKDFLDAQKYGGEENVHQELNKIESERFFEDDSGLFKFEFDHIEYHNNEKHYFGILNCPDLILKGGKSISGRLEGKIIYNTNTKMTIPDFISVFNLDEFDIFDFCEGYEYELDSFIDYVVSELENKNEE